jgi:hypothetical protein
MSEFDDLTEQELIKISLEKNNKGNATNRALRAQHKLFSQSNYGFQHHSYRTRTAYDNYSYGEPSNFTKRFK